MSTVPSCPVCASDLNQVGSIELQGWADPIEGIQAAHCADLCLTCHECGHQFNAFVPLSDFQLLKESDL